ncbi:MAG: NAD(P)-dependent oxidoreductase [Actinobacteria bacterium]|nr:NAD(P)-dependent oxidoreductase [Actinomycetota bacterium]
MAETVLVTGATGFVGSHLVSALAGSGHRVHALVRTPGALGIPGVLAHPFTDSIAETPGIIDQVRPDVVVHLATRFAAQHDPGQLRTMVDANVTFGTVVAEGCARVGARLVHATSAWQHYEGATYAPVSLYAATKQAFVDVLAYYTQAAGLRAAEVCLFDTYGPADSRRKLVWLLLDAARTGAPLALGTGRPLIDLTHVDDVVAAFGVAVAGEVDGGRLVVRSGHPLSVRALAGLVEEVTGRRLDVEWDARPDRPREMLQDWDVPGSPSSWRPLTPLRDGLDALWRAEFA